jgi:hypothetical protein
MVPHTEAVHPSQRSPLSDSARLVRRLVAVMEAVAEVMCPGERMALLDRIVELDKASRRRSRPGISENDQLLAELAAPRPHASATAVPAVGAPANWQRLSPPPLNLQPQHQVMRRRGVFLAGERCTPSWKEIVVSEAPVTACLCVSCHSSHCRMWP